MADRLAVTRAIGVSIFVQLAKTEGVQEPIGCLGLSVADQLVAARAFAHPAAGLLPIGGQAQ